MPNVEVNGVRLNYIQIDNRENDRGPDLVMIHGLATSLAFWYLQHAPHFADAYRITLYDLRGHGRSGTTAEGYTPCNMSLDLGRLLDHLGIDRAHFVAHSFGGVVALNLACREQQRFTSLVLVDSHIDAVRRCLNGCRWEFGEKIQPLLRRHGIDIDIREPYFGYKMLSAAARLYENNTPLSAELEKVLEPAIGRFSRRTAAQWLHLLRSTRAAEELMGEDGLSLDRLRRLHFPIMAMYGEHSQAMSTGCQLLQVWPQAEFYKIRDAGHFFPVTRPAEFVEYCRRFLDRSRTIVPRRDGDGSRRYFRSHRFYCHDEAKWFVDTREALRVGPFNSRAEAGQHLFALLGSSRRAGTRAKAR